MKLFKAPVYGWGVLPLMWKKSLICGVGFLKTLNGFTWSRSLDLLLRTFQARTLHPFCFSIEELLPINERFHASKREQSWLSAQTRFFLLAFVLLHRIQAPYWVVVEGWHKIKALLLLHWWADILPNPRFLHGIQSPVSTKHWRDFDVTHRIQSCFVSEISLTFSVDGFLLDGFDIIYQGSIVVALVWADTESKRSSILVALV